MNVGLYSYAFNNLNSDIIEYQKKVFNKFGLNLKQLIFQKDSKFHNDHATGLSEIIKNSTEDYLIIFDIDCIPLSIDFYNCILDDVSDNNTLAGAVGCANHKDPNKLYIHPCFMSFNKSLYYECGSPSLSEYESGDVAQKFTDVCLLKNKRIKFWNVSSSLDETWNLKPINKKFGHGTVYEGLIYHQYQIRMAHQQQCFIDKCKQILSN